MLGLWSADPVPEVSGDLGNPGGEFGVPLQLGRGTRDQVLADHPLGLVHIRVGQLGLVAELGQLDLQPGQPVGDDLLEVRAGALGDDGLPVIS